MEVVRKVIPYRPRSLFLPYHQRKQRWAALVAHRRCGKTVATINDMIRRAVTNTQPRGRYAYVAPYLGQGKEVAWEYLQHYTRDLVRAVNVAELRVTLLNGSSIRIHGADNPDRLRGSYLDGCILDEYADMRPSVWDEVVRPMLADREGWATFIGTPKGKNDFWKIVTRAEQNQGEWFVARLPVSLTSKLDPPALNPIEVEAARREMTPERFEQEFECSFEAAIRGAYFGKELADAEREGRITDVAYERDLPVHTAWDLGIGDATSIWFWQVNGKELRVIDHYENHGKALSHYAGVLSARSYSYGDDYVPHDARVHDLGTGRSRVETLRSLGRNPRLVPRLGKMDGINAARLSLPHCWFDAEKCRDGLESLRQYHADYDERLKTYKDEPKHDWTSHAADAFRYMCVAWREMVPEADKPDPIKELLRRPSLDELLKQYDEERGEE